MYKDTLNSREVNPLLRQAWVNLLNRYEWTWFTTLTFRDLPKSYTAINRVNRWLTAIKNQEKRAIGYYMVTEWFKTQKCPHMHLLMGGLQGVNRSKWWKVWFTWYGRNRILPYRKELGCQFYLTKYVIKEKSDIGLFEIRGLQYINQLYFKGVD